MRGQKVLASFKMLTDKDTEYSKNCLWWAYHAGNMADQVWMTTEVQSILETIAYSKSHSISVPLRKRVLNILVNKEDYSIQKL